ncbi:MAG: hypothetical protein JXQ71_08240 [Verrucomicrobia bacterium]|nr:hypothetical protein [Verrucomicrobiota bacterium]
MVRAYQYGTRAWILAGLLLVFSASATPIFDLHIGDLAPTNIAAPAHLTVPDPVRTAELRRQAAERVPPVFRFDATVVRQVVSAFEADLDERRAAFLAGLKQQFGPEPPTPSALTSSRFEDFCATFLKDHPRPVVTSNFLASWARGEPDDVLRAEWAILLRAFMERRIRPDTPPEPGLPEPPTAWVLPATAALKPLSERTLEQLGERVPRTDLVTLTKARNDVLDCFPPHRHDAARHLASLLRANCTLDETLTQTLRAQHTEPILAAVRFVPGQIILQAGQIVDPLARAALDQLQERDALIRHADPNARLQPTTVPPASAHSPPLAPWIAVGLAATALLGLLWHRRQDPPPTLSLAHALPTTVTCPNCATPIPIPAPTPDISWQTRAIEAERRADQATALVRQGLLPQLAHWLKQRFVRSLVAQRNHALEIHAQAAEDLTGLEYRLAQVQQPLTDKLRHYENRITVLEQQLAREHTPHRQSHPH